MMTGIERVRNFLANQAPDLSIIEFEADTSTSVLAARALGTEVGQIAKSMVFKTKSNDYLMVVSTGDSRINSKAIKELAGSKASMANAEEVLAVTGFSPGGICPFGLKTKLPIYLDESLKRYEVVYAAAGTANSVLPITFAKLQSVTGGIPCKVSE